MAALAVGSELPAMQIGVTYRTACCRLGEHRVSVTVLAVHSLVQAQQWETRLPVVVELRLPANWFPRNAGVAVFATNVERPVRISRTAANSLLRRQRNAR